MEKINVDTEEWGVQHLDHECGPCTACCVWLGVEELKKFTGQKCKHLRNPVYAHKRCGIYPSRPKACVEYQCLWREGWGPKDMRPHESGILVTPYLDHNNPDQNKVSFTVNVFDMDKAADRYNNVIAALLTLTFTVEVRLIFIKQKRALLFRDGKVYQCKLLPAEGYEALLFEAKDEPIGTYLAKR